MDYIDNIDNITAMNLLCNELILLNTIGGLLWASKAQETSQLGPLPPSLNCNLLQSLAKVPVYAVLQCLQFTVFPSVLQCQKW